MDAKAWSVLFLLFFVSCTAAESSAEKKAGRAASSEQVSAGPQAGPLEPGKTYRLDQLALNTSTEPRDFFTDVYLVLCEPAPCPPCGEGRECAECIESILYFADEPLTVKTSAELEGRPGLLQQGHYEFCPQLTKYKLGERNHLKIRVQNIYESGVYNDMQIVPEEDQ